MRWVLNGISLVLVVAALSCSSFGGFSLPGERDRVYKNILSEYFLVGDAYLENKKYSKAIEFYTKALSHPDLKESARYKIAYAHAQAENWDEAIALYKELFEMDHGNTTLERIIGYLYARQGNLVHACATYRKLVEKNPYDQSLLENFITVLLAGNYLEEAESAINRLKTDFPDNDSAEDFETKLAEGWENQEGKPIPATEDSGGQLSEQGDGGKDEEETAEGGDPIVGEV